MHSHKRRLIGWPLPGIELVGMLSITAIVAHAPSVQAASLTEWSFDPKTNRLEVAVNEPTTPRYFLMAQPARIVLDLPDTSVGAVKPQGTYSGAIRQVRVSQFQPGLTRIVMELAPTVTLAPGQVQLQKVTHGSKAGSRWVLRPLIASAASPTIAAQEPAPPALTPRTNPVPTVTVPPLERSSDESAVKPPVTSAPVAATLEIPVALPSAIVRDTPSPTIQVPPLNSSAVGGAAGIVAPGTDSTSTPLPPLAPVPATVGVPAAPSVSPTISAAPGLESLATSGLPTVTVPSLQSSPLPAVPSISVPPLQPASPASTPASVTVPPLQPNPVPSLPEVSSPALSAPRQNVGSPPSTPIVEFGQPLPTSTRGPQASNILLPAGTLLNLRYPGRDSLSLRTGTPHQEVLLLASEIRDTLGNLILPADSMVIGRFETGSSGSRFITQAISLMGRNVPLLAHSENLAGSRKIAEQAIVRNSGIGALAGGVIGGFSGLGIVGGAATGAAVTYLTSPKPATIQPDQILQVRLVEDLR